MAFNITRDESGGGKRDIWGPLNPKPPVNGGKGPVDPRSALWAPLAPVKSAPQRKPSRPSSGSRGGTRGGGSSYGGGGGGSYGGGYAPAAVSAMSEKDWLAQDKTYQATLASLERQLKDYVTDIDTQLGNRKLDYDKAIKDLGYTPGAEGADGSWNWSDLLTASGRSYQAMLNDYAARGMIQGSGFADAQNSLTRTLNDQYQGMSQSNKQFIDDMGRQKTKAQSENTDAQNAARAESILRRAAQYGFGS